MIVSPFLKQGRRSGIALVLVLSVLILLTAVVVAFFTNATTDLTSSKGYSDELRVKLLGDSAVNLVEAQIRKATEGAVDPTQNGSAPLAWASQPGMIRTYDTTGNTVAAYKLYSSDTALEKLDQPLTSAQLASEVPAAWQTMPSDYVDLNSPSVISDPNGTIVDPNNPNKTYSARFPIVDGNNLKSLNGALAYDADGDGLADIEGFSVKPPSSYSSGAVISPSNNPVPMPVRWLYELQNGELHPRDAQGQILNASATNPVVGRVAYWTDDDTCKLNVNVASEGTFWSPPRAKTNRDVQNSLDIPAQNEFQMFSGHPAKTSLSTVFGSKSIWPIPGTPVNGVFKPTFLSTTNDYTALLPYYDLVPRVTQGLTRGSAGGTQPVSSNNTTGILYDTDRLYASIDELMFNTRTNSNGTTRSTRNAMQSVDGGGQAPAITPAFLETTRFFLTTTNRAPEVTLLNTPRISLWPLMLQPSQRFSSLRTAKDKLLAFCSTIPDSTQNGPQSSFIYYFQRLNASTTVSSGLSSEDPFLDFDQTQMPRNNQLYKYLQQLTQADVPGLGGNFLRKYPTNRDQILTEMVDQIRSGVNTLQANGGTGGDGSYCYPKVRLTSGEGQVVGLQNPAGTTSRGFGRFSTISEVALDFCRCNAPNPLRPDDPIVIGALLILQPFNVSPGFPTWSPSMQITVQGLQNFSIQNAGDPSTLQSLRLPSIGTNFVDALVGFHAQGHTTEFNTLGTMFYTSGAVKTFTSTSGGNSAYPWYNTPAVLPATYTPGLKPSFGQLPKDSASFDFIGGPLTITIRTNPDPETFAPTGTVVQTLTVNFPNSSGLPVPGFNPDYSTIASKGSSGYPPAPGTTPASSTPAAIYTFRLASGILNPAVGYPANQTGGLAQDGQASDPHYHSGGSYGTYGPGSGAGTGLIDRYDVVRSIIVDPLGPSKGDYRVIAALPKVGPEYFTTHPFYNYAGVEPPISIDPNPAQRAYNWRFATSLRTGDNPGWGALGWYNYSGMTNQASYLAPIYPAQPQPTRSRPIPIGDATDSVARRPAYSGTLIPLDQLNSPVPPSRLWA